eukprot:scaffold3731_cov63-Phaeocystis_antarctica.AAC.3
MAKTFDTISDALATNYLFIFSQRTLALQNELPTPPPLNALGLPCEAICRLWAWLCPKKAAAHEYLSVYLVSIGAVEEKAAEGKVPAAQEALPLVADLEETASDKVAGGEIVAMEEAGAEQLKGTVTKATSDKARSSASSSSSKEATQEEETLAIKVALGEEAPTAVKAATVLEAAEGAVAMRKMATEKTYSVISVEGAYGQGKDSKKTVAETIAPLAKKITAYILDHQDDAAHEDHWRIQMQRNMSKSFRAQREAMDTQREAMDTQREAMDTQREASDKQRKAIEIRLDLQHHAINEVHSKLDETIQLVRNLANQLA